MNTAIIYGLWFGVFLNRENDTMDPGDPPYFFKSNFMKSRISNRGQNLTGFAMWELFQGRIQPGGTGARAWQMLENHNTPFEFSEIGYLLLPSRDMAESSLNRRQSSKQPTNYNTIQDKCLRITIITVWYIPLTRVRYPVWCPFPTPSTCGSRWLSIPRIGLR